MSLQQSDKKKSRLSGPIGLFIVVLLLFLFSFALLAVLVSSDSFALYCVNSLVDNLRSSGRIVAFDAKIKGNFAGGLTLKELKVSLKDYDITADFIYFISSPASMLWRARLPVEVKVGEVIVRAKKIPTPAFNGLRIDEASVLPIPRDFWKITSALDLDLVEVKRVVFEENMGLFLRAAVIENFKLEGQPSALSKFNCFFRLLNLFEGTEGGKIEKVLALADFSGLAERDCSALEGQFSLMPPDKPAKVLPVSLQFNLKTAELSAVVRDALLDFADYDLQALLLHFKGLSVPAFITDMRGTTTIDGSLFFNSKIGWNANFSGKLDSLLNPFVQKFAKIAVNTEWAILNNVLTFREAPDVAQFLSGTIDFNKKKNNVALRYTWKDFESQKDLSIFPFGSAPFKSLPGRFLKKQSNSIFMNNFEIMLNIAYKNNRGDLSLMFPSDGQSQILATYKTDWLPYVNNGENGLYKMEERLIIPLDALKSPVNQMGNSMVFSNVKNLSRIPSAFNSISKGKLANLYPKPSTSSGFTYSMTCSREGNAGRYAMIFLGDGDREVAKASLVYENDAFKGKLSFAGEEVEFSDISAEKLFVP
ncbi:MAG: hypothetical protein GX221_09225 [Candidatus Riflebacteria bacterium]|nr:hypothetical protein [Candidatus Riflebacteria bacterium]